MCMFNFIIPRFYCRLERWKWNKEFRVYVSNFGHFKDEHKNELPVLTRNNGYLAIKTNYGIKSAHRLVMLTWRPIPNAEDLTVDHLDHNKRNNSIYNLEWGTAEENTNRAKRDFINEPANRIGVKNSLGKIFNSYEDAADWVINNKIHEKQRKHVNKKNIIKRIRKSVNSNEEYLWIKWEEIDF